MSTQLRNVTSTLTQTRFFGGSHRGPCVQITQVNEDNEFLKPQFIQLTRHEAAQLAAELALFAVGKEVVDE